MAIQTNTNTDFLNRTSGLLDYNQPYTFMFWLMSEVDTNGSTTSYSANDGSLNSFDLTGHDSDGLTTRITTRTNGAGALTSTGSLRPLLVWEHWALVRISATQILLYINGNLDITHTTATVAARSAASNNHMGIQVGGFAPFNGKFDKIKEFNVALSVAEIQAEIWRTLPQIADSRLNDFAPVMIGPNSNKALRGNDWIENGTLIDESGSPTTWGGTSVIPLFPLGADTTAPILTLPTGIQTGSTTASGTVTTDEGNGTLFYLATVNATETAATIKAGSSQSVTTTGIQNVTVTGLTAATTYFLHYVHDDAAANESNVVASASFTTDAVGGFNPVWANRSNNLMGAM